MKMQDLQARYRERNARAHQPVPVDIKGVGTLFVRRLSIDDAEFMSLMASSGENGNAQALIMAGMLCHEDGSRLSTEEAKAWMEIFQEAPSDDYTAMRAKAMGEEDGPNSGN